MKKEKTFEIDEKTYDWYMGACRTVEKYLGLKVHVYDDHGALPDGQIFLFNHFTRFETAIPPYILHRETKQYARSIADYSLFEINDKFSNFLGRMGAIPNRYPGLLSYLAGEILRGRKVIIFPEGGLVKDKRVLDDQGRFRVYSARKKEYKKQHRGAAVLALILDLFKQRVLSLYENNDQKRIDHWCRSLGLENKAYLLREVSKPTLIVPSTITFYPIRIGSNILDRSVKMFLKDVPEALLEELTIEGNILFRNTDMDVHFNKPIEAHKELNWLEKKVLENYFLSIKDLDDLFTLRDSATNWSEKLLEQMITRETGLIRDKYMESIYCGVMINLNHLISELIVTLIDSGVHEIPCHEFHKVLYLALKELQENPDIRAHGSITWPEFYSGLLEGTNEDFQEFIQACTQAGLIRKENGNYILRKKLQNEFGYHEIRRQNPVLVNANEAAPIQAVDLAIKNGLNRVESLPEKEIANYLFDDEVRDYGWHRAQFADRDVKGNKISRENGHPFFLKREQSKTGVLLIHGLLETPAKMRALGDTLYEDGFTVLGMRLPGHGTSPWDLHEQTYKDLLEAVRRNYQILSAHVDQVVIVGFSTGGALGLILSSESPKKLSGIASVSTPLALRDRNTVFVPLVGKLNRTISKLPGLKGIIPFYDNGQDHPETNYDSIPVQAIYELQETIRHLKKALPKVKTPALVIQGDKDHVIVPDSAQKIFDRLGTEEKELHWIKTERHGLIDGHVGKTWDLIHTFVKTQGKDK